jgi:hypothetical protein
MATRKLPALGIVLVVGTVVSAILHARTARGQDDWDVPKKHVDRAMEEGQWTLPNFDQWVLRGRNRKQIETTLKQKLSLQVQNVNRARELSDAQREKLQMAGEFDIKRMSRAIDELREKFRLAGQDQDTYSRLITEGSMMQQSLQSGVSGDTSLFQKVLQQTLNQQQSAQYEQQERERRKFHYQAKIELTFLNLEGSISLTADQRQQLIKLLVDQTEPPKKFGQYDTYAIFYKLGKISDAKLKPILDDSQRQALKKMIDRFRGIEPTLRSQGYL